MPVVTDLTNDNSLANLLARTRAEFGPVDILVNNAGYVLWKPLEATAIAEWDQGHPRQPPQQRDQGLDRLPRLR